MFSHKFTHTYIYIYNNNNNNNIYKNSLIFFTVKLQ